MSTKRKEFLVVLEPDERTGFLLSDEELAESIKIVLGSVVRVWTGGSIPKVEVTFLPERPSAEVF